MFTERLEIRLPMEADRARFVELWTQDAFMVFSDGVKDEESANGRFDRMLHRATEFPFAKQPVIERATGELIGYSGMDVFEFEGEVHLEYGYRLEPEARGNGYATEASTALLAVADAHPREGLTADGRPVSGDRVVAIIDPMNHPSQNVALKIGFTFWQFCEVNGFYDNLYLRPLGQNAL